MYTEDSPDGPHDAAEAADPVRERIESNPLRNLLSSEFTHAISAALLKLTPEHRAVLMLKVDEGMRYDEIAETLGISRGTVMSRLFRARAHLTKLLEEYRR